MGGEPLIRKGVDMAMRMMGEQFVTGETIAEALANARRARREGFRYSFDMLGEAALTAQDAQRYLQAYEDGHPRDRQGLGRPRHLRGAGHLDQAVGAASALQPRAARTRDGELYPVLVRLCAAGQGLRHRPEHRRRRSRPARTVARPAGALASSRNCKAGWASAS
jgi:RHH-type proline utilization regulon transcriptional repressor/proline dehydrogenase/delta 1-pyrroline-5-carboxylate dehydrogenase